jgi:hypothetical protein
MSFKIICNKCKNQISLGSINLEEVNQTDKLIQIDAGSWYGGEEDINIVCNCGNQISIRSC